MLFRNLVSQKLFLLHLKGFLFNKVLKPHKTASKILYGLVNGASNKLQINRLFFQNGSNNMAPDAEKTF